MREFLDLAGENSGAIPSEEETKMPVVQVAAQLSTEDLLQAAGQLPQPELEQFTQRILAIQAERRAPRLPPDESALLQQINDWMPQALKSRYGELLHKRQEETLTEPEYEELQQLTDRVEVLEADRLKHVGELARIRKTSLRALMEDFGLSGSFHV